MLTLIIIYLILIKITQSRLIIYGAYTITALLPNYIAYNNVIGTRCFYISLFYHLLQVYPFKPWIRYPLWEFYRRCGINKAFLHGLSGCGCLYVLVENKSCAKQLYHSLPFPHHGTGHRPGHIEIIKIGRFIDFLQLGYVLYINNNHYNATGA